MDSPPLPPNQQLVAPGKWPIIGERAAGVDAERWTVSIAGAVEQPLEFAIDQLRELPQVQQTVDIHCVTRWSRLGMRFAGVRLAELLDRARPTRDARFISFVARSDRRHSTSLPLADALNLDALIALAADGRPLQPAHGGPLRVVVPGRYFYKSLKWLARIDLLPADRLGFWESAAGYHNGADPWREQRYMAPGLTRQQASAILDQRDVTGRDLRSIDAEGRDLSGLAARGALLRDANFRGCNLENARFNGANLSNAHFAGARLCGASFAGADVEGADFGGADLQAADFSGASLIGATFCVAGTEPDSFANGAIFDASTRFDPASLENLMPLQQRFLNTVWRPAGPAG